MSPEPLLDDKQTEKQVVKGYFETTGFERWNRIYSETDDVNKVQRNIRIGHQKTVDEVLTWIKESDALGDVSFCDAGCGVGSLSLPLAEMGAGSIDASDISEAMAKEAERESLSGSFHTVCCLDVFIHYPQPAAEEMVRHLCSLTENRLIVSFAPYTPLLALLKGIGQLFPGPSKTTRAYTLRETGIVQAAEDCGFKMVRRSLNKAPFYFSRLVEFRKTNLRPSMNPTSIESPQ
jgi:magnesium-protoporphyrin O-methyltransferase